jgi:hypothetical protein
MWVHSQPPGRYRSAWLMAGQSALGAVLMVGWWLLCQHLYWPGWALFLGYFAAIFAVSRLAARLRRRWRA